MRVAEPVIGDWYRRPNGSLFEIVAFDEQAATIELQFFDGTIDEVDMETWPTLIIEKVGAPEDWSGSVDMDPDDFVDAKSEEMPRGYHNPLSFLEDQ